MNAAASPDTAPALDLERLRADFPILAQQIHGQPLVYLDNAATAQKPLAVIQTLDRYYREYNANIHRGVHTLSERATAAHDDARGKVRNFINAASAREIIFTRGTTESINLVAQSYGRANFKAGDEILITEMEHHSNIVPWQILCEQTGAELRVVPIDDNGEVMLEDFERLLGPKTRLVSIVHVSNALGTINPVRDMTARAHAHGAVVLVDGAQAVPHGHVDVREIDCDFYAFSGHKLFGPTGIGVLYGREKLLDAMPPYQGGGDMIKMVTFDKTVYNDLPHKFEAGTPHIAGAIGLGAAIDYVSGLGLAAIQAHEHDLLEYAAAAVAAVDGVRLIGTAAARVGVLSFIMDGIHPHDLGTILDHDGIAIRAGHHCAMPVMDRFGVPATARASFAFYNTKQEVDLLVRGLEKAKKVFS